VFILFCRPHRRLGRRRAAAIVSAIAAGSQHSTMSSISHRMATSTSTPAIAASLDFHGPELA